jgi:hypothetical protein
MCDSTNIARFYFYKPAAYTTINYKPLPPINALRYYLDNLAFARSSCRLISSVQKHAAVLFRLDLRALRIFLSPAPVVDFGLDLLVSPLVFYCLGACAWLRTSRSGL